MFSDGVPDLQSLLQQAAAMQEQLATAQQELEEARVEGSSGGGLVHATVSGTGELIGLTIDPSVCDPDDPETLADLVVAAVQNASDNAQKRAAAAMGGIAGDIGAGLGALMGGGLSDEPPSDEPPSDDPVLNYPMPGPGAIAAGPSTSLNVGFSNRPDYVAEPRPDEE